MSYMYGKCFDYNDYVKQVRGFLQGHPQVHKVDLTDPQSGIVFTGTGVGELYVSTESYTPAGQNESPGAVSPEPGTQYLLTCTVAGSAITSPQAQFTVEQVGISPGILGTLTAGERFVPDGDISYLNSPQITSPVASRSPEHGLNLILTTSTNWVIADTISFYLVDHFIGRDVNDNYEEKRFTQAIPDANGDFITEWFARMPSIAKAVASPESPAHCGLLTSFDDAQSRRNVGITGAAAYVSSNTFNGMPGGLGTRYAFLSNVPMLFWISADADGFYAVVRAGATYQHMTTQLIDVIATGNQHPLPLFTGAMSENNDEFAIPSSVDNDQYAAFFDPGIESSSKFRWVDGSAVTIENRAASYSKGIVPTAYFLPYKQRNSRGSHTSTDFPSEYDWSLLSHQMLPRYDGSYEMVPITLAMTSPQNAIVGNLRYIKYVSGNGLTAEDTTVDSSVSPEQSWIAFSHANLSDNDNFCVMLLE